MNDREAPVRDASGAPASDAHADRLAAPPDEPRPFVSPSIGALVLLGAWLVLFALAPPANNSFWGVNGLRSIPAEHALWLVFAAAGAALLAWREPRGVLVRAVAVAALATLLAFGLRDALHLLGDTATRYGAIVNALRGMYAQPLSAWARQLHAQPLDLATGFLLPVWLVRRGASVEQAVSIVSWLLAVPALALAWSIARRLDAGRGAAWGLWLALVAWGGAQAWAGYAESTGIALLGGLALWAAMLAPLARSRDAALFVAAWMFALFAHRSAVLLLPAVLIRLLGPPLAGDDPKLRRYALAGVLSGLVFASAFGAGSRRVMADLRELFTPPAADAWASVPTDLLNLLLLLAPLAVAAPVLAGAHARRAIVRDPRAACLLVAALCFVPLACPLPIAASGLGIQRDWDLSAGLGLALTLAGALMLSYLPAARLRGALMAVVPVLVLGAGGWVATNADAAASLRRMAALASGEPGLAATQRSAVLLFAGNRAVDAGAPRAGARLLQASWELVPSPARGVHTIVAWLHAAEPESARVVSRAMRARGGLDARTTASLDTLEAQIRLLSDLPGRR